MIGDKPIAPTQLSGANLRANPSSTQDLIKLFKVGQIMKATVIEQSSNGRIRLQSGNQVFKAALPDNTLRTGDTLSLRIESLAGKLQLAILGRTDERAMQFAALRQLMPKQENLAPLLQQLSTMNKQPQTTLSQPLQQAVNQLLQRALGNEKVSPDKLRELFKTSGLFMESALAGGRPPADGDVKWLILRMLSLLQVGTTTKGSLLSSFLSQLSAASSKKGDAAATQMVERRDLLLSELRRLLEGALAGTEVKQIRTMQHRDEGRLVWQFSLPIQDEERIDDIEITIERDETKERENDQETWTVSLHFNFDATGPMDALVTVKEEQVSVVFWADHDDTLERINRYLPDLQQRLQESGLTIDRLAAYRGSAPETRPPMHLQAHSGMLDEQA